MKNLAHWICLFLIVCRPSLGRADDGPPDHSPKKVTYDQLSHDDQVILDNGEISEQRYISGGAVGSVIGLGIGHAIQGRYSEKGWIFTAGELGSVVVLVAGASECTVGVLEGTGCATGAGLMLGGYLGFFGFKIWEIVDLWATPPELNRRYHQLKDRVGEEPSYHLMFSPIVIERAPGLGLAVIF
jgi:hypothetical protein